MRTSGRPARRAKGPTASAGRAAKSTFIPTAARRSRSGTWCSRSSIAWAIRRTTCGRCRSKNIDTGMGLERTAATLQGVPTNYHIDILLPIVQAAAEVCGVKYELRVATTAGGCGGSPTTCGPARSRCTRTSIPARTRKSTSSSGCCAGRCSTGIRWALREPFLHKLVPSGRRDDEAAVSGAGGNGEARRAA